jgi:hypothetical protein
MGLVRLKTGFLLLSKNEAAGLNRCRLVRIDQQSTDLVFGEGSDSLLQPVFHWLKEFKQLLQ